MQVAPVFAITQRSGNPLPFRPILASRRGVISCLRLCPISVCKVSHLRESCSGSAHMGGFQELVALCRSLYNEDRNILGLVLGPLFVETPIHRGTCLRMHIIANTCFHADEGTHICMPWVPTFRHIWIAIYVYVPVCTCMYRHTWRTVITSGQLEGASYSKARHRRIDDNDRVNQ